MDRLWTDQYSDICVLCWMKTEWRILSPCCLLHAFYYKNFYIEMQILLHQITLFHLGKRILRNTIRTGRIFLKLNFIYGQHSEYIKLKFWNCETQLLNSMQKIDRDAQVEGGGVLSSNLFLPFTKNLQVLCRRYVGFGRWIKFWSPLHLR